MVTGHNRTVKQTQYIDKDLLRFIKIYQGLSRPIKHIKQTKNELYIHKYYKSRYPNVTPQTL